MGLFVPAKRSRKGENGRLLIIGGSRQYHGAPVLSILAARRFVDLVYFCPGEADPQLIRAVKRIPEGIVLRGLDAATVARMDCVLFGIGLGKARFPLRKLANAKRLVVDGDGLKRLRAAIGRGALRPGTVLTPHEGEFRMLFSKPGTRNNVMAMAAKTGCVILKKGPVDIIADGRPGTAGMEPRTRRAKPKTNRTHNPGMTKGGTGDVLSGLVAALACKNDPFAAAVAGAKVNGQAGNMLMKKYGYNYSASDLAGALAEAYAKAYGKGGRRAGKRRRKGR